MPGTNYGTNYFVVTQVGLHWKPMSFHLFYLLIQRTFDLLSFIKNYKIIPNAIIPISAIPPNAGITL